MNRAPLLLVGPGGHATACIDVIEQDGRFAVAGLVGLPHEVGGEVLGYRVVGSDDDLADLLARHRHALVTVGQIKTPDPRMRLFALLEQYGADRPVIVSPRAYVSPHARLGSGTIVMHGAVVNAGAVIGRNCIVNTLAVIEHGVVLGAHCHVGPSASINGEVRIGAGTFIGGNATVRQSLTLGERCVIGMGQRVFADCETGARLPPWGSRSGDAGVAAAVRE